MNIKRLILTLILILAIASVGFGLLIIQGGEFAFLSIFLIIAAIVGGAFSRSAKIGFLAEFIAVLVSITPIFALEAGILGNPTFLAIVGVVALVFGGMAALTGFVSGRIAKRRKPSHMPPAAPSPTPS